MKHFQHMKLAQRIKHFRKQLKLEPEYDDEPDEYTPTYKTEFDYNGHSDTSTESSRVYRDYAFDENGTCRIAPPDGYVMDRPMYANISISGKSREEIYEKFANVKLSINT